MYQALGRRECLGDSPFQPRFSAGAGSRAGAGLRGCLGGFCGGEGVALHQGGLGYSLCSPLPGSVMLGKLLIFLGLSFLLCKRGIILPTSGIVKRVN